MISVITVYKKRNYKDDCGRSNDYLNYYLKYILKSKYVDEVIIVNLDNNILCIENKDSRIKIIETNYSDVWCKSWALNIGIRNSNNDIISILDSDLIIPENYFEKNIKLMDDKNIFLHVIPSYTSNKESFDFMFDENKSWNEKTLYKTNHLKEDATGPVIFRKFQAYDIGGFNENLFGWGVEDTDFQDRLINKGYKRIRVIDETIAPIHLEHDKKFDEKFFENGQYNLYISKLYYNKISYVWGDINKKPDYKKHFEENNKQYIENELYKYLKTIKDDLIENIRRGAEKEAISKILEDDYINYIKNVIKDNILNMIIEKIFLDNKDFIKDILENKIKIMNNIKIELKDN